MNWAALLLLLASVSLPAAAQFHLGVKGGLPFNDALDSFSHFEPASANWTIGPMVEVDLPFGFGAEFNALYRGLHLQSPVARYDANAWSFPLLAKYKFPGVGLRPYLSGGWVFRTIGDIPNLNSGANGFAVAGGVRFSALLLKIAPEIRFTQWSQTGSSVSGVTARRNQVEFLVGLTF